ncbi:MAG: hypothetical protein M1813_002730 [Trichoglossum hirsutum]|nr:MAG: hypothetical protein M1813_002730 [Trichoglossum hirsutum]
MKASFAASALLSFLSLASAAPTLNGRGYPAVHSPAGGSSTIYPIASSTFDASSNALTYGGDYGVVKRTQGSHDISTLITFDMPTSFAGKKCQFDFPLTSSAIVDGTGQIQVFTSRYEPVGDATLWGTQRDQDLGRVQAVNNGPSTGINGFSSPVTFDCPIGHYTIELVPTGDNDDVEWNVYTEGPEITALP